MIEVTTELVKFLRTICRSVPAFSKCYRLSNTSASLATEACLSPFMSVTNISNTYATFSFTKYVL